MMAYLMRLAIVMLLMTATAVSPQSGDKAPVFTNYGSLVLPSGFRSWVFIGGPITPNGLNELALRTKCPAPAEALNPRFAIESGMHGTNFVPQ